MKSAYYFILFISIFFQNVFLFANPAAGPGHHETYKSAAGDADEGKNAGLTVMGIHSAAAAVCGGVCASGETNPHICTGASVGAAGGEAAVNKDFQGALAGSVSTLTPQLMESMSGAGATVAAEAAPPLEGDAPRSAEKGSNKAACATSALHALQAASNAFGAQAAEEKGRSLEEMAEEVRNTDSSNLLTSNPQNDGDSPSNTTTQNGGGRSTESLPTNTSGLKNHPCTEAKTTGRMNAVMNCTLKNSPALTQLVSNPKFHDEFKKISGKELGEFIKSIPDGASRSPSSVLGAAFGGSGSLGSAQKFQKTFSPLDKVVAQFSNKGSSYASGGKRKSTHSKPVENKEMDPADFMKEMMAQLGLAEEQDQNKKAPKEIQRELAQEEKSTGYYLSSRSLFDQISYRYRASSGSRLWSRPWQSKENLKLNTSYKE